MSISTDIVLAGKMAQALKRLGFSANVWQKGDKSPRIYIKGSGGCRGFLEIQDGKVHGNLSGYGRSREAGDICTRIAEEG